MYLDLGQSEVFTERSQARWLGEGATAEKIKGGRHNTAEMKCSVVYGAKRNEAVLWMHKPDRTQEENVWRWGTKQRKKIAAVFQAAVFFSAVKCLWNGGKPNYWIEVLDCLFTQKGSYEIIRLSDWNCRTEQRERPKRDSWIARDFLHELCFGIDFKIRFIPHFWIIIMQYSIVGLISEQGIHQAWIYKLLFFWQKNYESEQRIPFISDGVSVGFPSPSADFMENNIDLNKELKVLY